MRTPPNPLFDLWQKTFGTDAVYSYWSRERRANFDADRIISTFGNRSEGCERYAFAVPSPEALALLVAMSPLVEIGAGTGYWASLIRQSGGDIVAYDIKEDSWEKWFPYGDFGGVEFGTTAAASDHPDRTLFLCWPPYASPMAYTALKFYEEAGGQRVVYIGEGPGGCTADDQFFCAVGHGCGQSWDDEHDCADDPEPTWRLTGQLVIPQWEGIHDELAVYERL